jgi:hypothetical protein
MRTVRIMFDFRPRSLGVSPRIRGLCPCFSTGLWAALILCLAAVNTGCTSSLTAIALRDAMREIAEFGQRGDGVVEEAGEEQFADDAETPELMSLEEALNSAVTRLAAVGRLDADSRQMLLETLESTSQEDWPVVIESFASSLEELARGDEAIEKVAETLDVEAADKADDSEGLPAEEMVAAIDADDVNELPQPADSDPVEAPVVAEPAGHEERVANDGPSGPMLAEEEGQGPAVASVAGMSTDEDVVPSLAAAGVASDSLAEESPAGDEAGNDQATGLAADAESLPVLNEASHASSGHAAANAPPAAAGATQEGKVFDEPPSPLADRVTNAIRELPVSEASTLSPEETMRRLEEALALARRQAPLRVDNPCFAWQVRAWGDVERCEVSQFHNGQQVIVYFEVDNLTSEKVLDGHATKLDTTLRLVNVSGECLHEWRFPPLTENCPAPRRDYFARYILEVPEGIAPGPLRLEMTVNDLLGEKSADVSLPLEVIREPAAPNERVASDATFLR